MKINKMYILFVVLLIIILTLLIYITNKLLNMFEKSNENIDGKYNKYINIFKDGINATEAVLPVPTYECYKVVYSFHTIIIRYGKIIEILTLIAEIIFSVYVDVKEARQYVSNMKKHQWLYDNANFFHNYERNKKICKESNLHINLAEMTDYMW